MGRESPFVKFNSKIQDIPSSAIKPLLLIVSQALSKKKNLK
jgi:hypothetical protein